MGTSCPPPAPGSSPPWASCSTTRTPQRAKEDIKGVMKALNDHLLAKTFLVGERISLADIAVCCTLLSLYKQVMDPSFRGAYQNVNRWFTTVVNQPNAKAVLGEVVLCSKEAQFDAKKFAEFSGKGDKKKEEKPKKEQQPKKEPEKKKEKPAEGGGGGRWYAQGAQSQGSPRSTSQGYLRPGGVEEILLQQ